ncbi:MAG: ABC transporter ATP-binding protein [Proteobacteria bacterium]|nr:MAG: ABC transporter ATP-binding protein [Pseudomonadota bacterium]
MTRHEDVNIEEADDLIDAPALKVEGLSTSRGDFRLGPISMDIPMGTVTGLIGPNGSGKTTLMSSIMGLLKPEGGRVEVCGKFADPNEGEWKQNVGFVFQGQGFFQDFSVEENLRFFSKIYRDWDSQYCRSLMIRMSVKADRKVGELSTGEKAKLAFIAAASHRPALLILDEPTNGMDVLIREEFLEAMGETVRNGDNSALISTHILSDVSGIADHLTFVSEGRISHHFAKDELLDSWRRVSFRTEQDINILPWIEKVERQGEFYVVTTSNAPATLKVLDLMGVKSVEQQRIELGEITRLILTGKARAAKAEKF